jgi:hypothetical protein
MIRLPIEKIWSILVLALLLLIPLTVHAQSGTMGSAGSPVEPPLVRQGTLALKLGPALNLGTPHSEAEAMGRLAEAGIVPHNGWREDYPVTPDLVGELQQLVGGAADNRTIPLDRFAALERLADVVAALDLPITPGGEVNGDLAYDDPDIYADTSTEEYYYDTAPPVVTYYAPPSPYYSSYAWVPYPFWFYGVQFSGYYILRDFHRPIHFKNRPVFISNRHHGGGAKFIHGHRHTAPTVHKRHFNKSGEIKVKNHQPQNPWLYIPPSGVHRINTLPPTSGSKGSGFGGARIHDRSHRHGESIGHVPSGGTRGQIIQYRSTDHYREVSGARRGESLNNQGINSRGSGRNFNHFHKSGGWSNRGFRR